MSVFRFKRFSVSNERSAMKVNTDGVLLGAAAILYPSDRQVLDVGTGTGTIALMIAQRLSDMGVEDFRIAGIDIDFPSAQEAMSNFEASEWRSRMEAHHCSLQTYACAEKFDLIISNPPFFVGDLKAPSQRRNAARHGDDSLTYSELMEFSSIHLCPSGRLSIILPVSVEQRVLREAGACGLYPMRVLHIRTTPSKPFTRAIIDFSFKVTETIHTCLTMNEQGSRTPLYNSLVSDFLLN